MAFINLKMASILTWAPVIEVNGLLLNLIVIQEHLLAQEGVIISTLLVIVLVVVVEFLRFLMITEAWTDKG